MTIQKSYDYTGILTKIQTPQQFTERKIKRSSDPNQHQLNNRTAEQNVQQQNKRIHASCEDYRAAATIDLDHDKKDRNKKLNIPIHVLWGKKGVVGKQFSPIKIWQKYTKKKVYGAEINSEHFIPEESPKQTINHLKKFFLKDVKNISK